MTIFDEPTRIEALEARVQALEAALLDAKPKSRTDCPPEIAAAWSLWCLHKAGQKNWTPAARKLHLSKLATLSELDPDKAMRIVEVGMERGWTCFWPLKDEPAAKPSNVRPIGVKAALKPSETPLERAQAWARQQHNLGQIDAQERDRLITEAAEKYRERLG